MSEEQSPSSSHRSALPLLQALGVPPAAAEFLNALWGRVRGPARAGAPLDQARLLLRELGEPSGAWESSRITAARSALRRFVGDESVAPARWLPVEVPALPALLARAQAGDWPLALTFAGQAVPYVDELRALMRDSPRASRLLRRMLAHSRDCVKALPLEDRAPFGGILDDDNALDALEASGAPPSWSAAVSGPLVFATQVARYAAVLEPGYAQPAFWRNVVATAGHSQGALAALFVSESWERDDFDERAAEYAAFATLMGLRLHQARGTRALPPHLTANASAPGTPTFMASLVGPTGPELRAAVAQLAPEVTVALCNGAYRHVVSGDPAALESFHRAFTRELDERRAARSRGRNPGRVPSLDWTWLEVSGPFHSSLMQSRADQLRDDVGRLRFSVPVGALRLPVLDPLSGEPLADDGSVVDVLIQRLFVDPVNWRATTLALRHRGVRCVIDFGPSDAVARLCSSNLKGQDVAVVAAATAVGTEALFERDHVPAASGPLFDSFTPRLRQRSNGGCTVENRFTRLTGCPPFLVPGMTPTTADAPIVVAAANAGYFAELAGGGQVTAAILRRRMDEVARTLAPGRGIVFNALYLDPHLWSIHLGKERLVQRLREEGYPIVGVTVSAGVPPLEEAVSLLRELVGLGIRLNSFKPGTDAQIEAVLQIARACPDIDVIVQVEGGKAGGHHSWEDLDDLLLRHHAALRGCPNVTLAVGGGISDEETATAYLTGAWSTAHGFPRMPVDAVFMGTRLMACREAATSPAVKDALVRARGSETWPQEGRPAGDVTSGRSPLDAPIYHLANAAAEAGRILDEVAGDAQAVAARHDEIVAALARTAKPWFGDVAGMTYERMLRRLVELTAVGRDTPYDDGVWPDPSFRSRFLDLVRCAEARLTDATEAFVPLVAAACDADEPDRAIDLLVQKYPCARTTHVHPDDVLTFLQVCRSPGKPVNFVPVLDAEVRRWFKSDSLWQSHHPGYAADEVIALPGPKGLCGVASVDEPVAEVLARFERHLAGALLSEPLPHRDGASHGTLQVQPLHLQQPARWFDALTGLGDGPIVAAVREYDAVVAHRRARNPLRSLLAPAPGLAVNWRTDHHGILTLLEACGAEGRVFARLQERDGELRAQVISRRDDVEAALDLALTFVPDARRGYVRWDREAYLSNQAAFYGMLLFGRVPQSVAPFTTASGERLLEQRHVDAFLAATADDSPLQDGPPLNMAFSLAWDPIFATLCGARADVPALIHESNNVDRGASWPPRPGDVVRSDARLIARECLGLHTRLVVEATVWCRDACAATVESRFLVREPVVTAHTEERRGAFSARITLRGDADAQFLREQPWFISKNNAALSMGAVLDVRCPDWVERQEPDCNTFAARGVIVHGDRHVGEVRLEEGETATRVHPVAAVCALLAAPDEPTGVVAPRSLGSLSLRAPASMRDYACASGDYNPLHVDPDFARFAGHAGVLAQGMWTGSAAMHRAVRLASDGDSRRLRHIETRFSAPVFPSGNLQVTVQQSAVLHGGPVVDVDVVAQRGESRVTVLAGSAQIAPPRTAYVFPGQGVQAQGMGMEGYARSRAARATWDEAELRCRERFGFSLLHVVRENPRELLVDGTPTSHPAGVLFLTQFTQVAMAVMAVAQTRELHERGLLVPDAMFCGHSLGEYSALAALGDAVSLTGLVDVVYQRGVTMDRLVARDRDGKSPYAMGVIRPHEAGLDEAAALALVDDVRAQSGQALEVVNHNVRGRQYSVTGHVDALRCLAAVLLERQQAARSVRKPAYVEVPGIDVPFHSTLLRDGVDAFRSTLEQTLPPRIAAERLVGRYVPNLVGIPFSLERPFVERAAAVSGSPVLRRLLDAALDDHDLSRVLLVELLAYQFASPVRWIDSQETLLTRGVERVVEIGVAHQPTLANMMRATLGTLGPHAPRVEVLHGEVDSDALVGPPAVKETKQPQSPAPTLPPPQSAPAENAEKPTASAPDQPVTVKDALFTLLSVHARRRLDQLSAEDTLDELLGGNSARRNQVLADVAAEFCVRPMDNAHELPLGKLADALAVSATTYQAPGAYLKAAQDAVIQRVLGVARLQREDVLSRLTSRWALGNGSAQAVLNQLVLDGRDGESSRGGPLSTTPSATVRDEETAAAWLDALAHRSAQIHGTRLEPRRTEQEAVAVDAGALRQLEERIVGPEGVLARTARALQDELALPRAHATVPSSADPVTAQSAHFHREHGDAYNSATRSIFDPHKHVAFTSAWAWARRDVAALAGRAARGEAISDTELTRLAARMDDDAVLAARALLPTRGGAVMEELLARATQPPRWRGNPTPVAQDVKLSRSDAVPWFASACRDGASFAGNTALVTGAGPGSIALSMVQGLLAGGARVVVTTSTYSSERIQLYKRLYQRHAARGAELHVVPANQGSFSDVDDLLRWIVAPDRERMKPAWVPDILVPFAATAETADLTGLGGASLGTLRVLLVGVERLIARVADVYREAHIRSRRCQVLLPLSPNQGLFGGDGLYGECKAALEALLCRWRSENDAWGRYTCVTGARIGWVRGTGLMAHHDELARRLEERTGVRTWGAEETADLLLALVAPALRARLGPEPLAADLTTGLTDVPDLAGVLRDLRRDTDREQRHARRLGELRDSLQVALHGEQRASPRISPAPRVEASAPIPRDEDLAQLPELDHLDPDQVVVVVGFGEVGPWGSARTRWSMERDGRLSLEAVAELAWMMGLITPQPGGTGFTDAASGAPVDALQIKARYEARVLSHAGVRVTEPETVGFNPLAARSLVEVYLDRDFAFPVADARAAEELRAADPDHTDVELRGERVFVIRRKGAVVRVPRALKLDRTVAGQIPTGWDPARYGIPQEMIQQVDRVTLFSLVSTVEAFLSAGTEPEEILAYLHPSRVGICQGTGIGGMQKLRQLYRNFYDGAPRQNDTLQETLINVIGGYIVQGYLGSYGSMSFPVAACATAAVSVADAVEKILGGGTDFMVTGGADDQGEEGLIGFADMRATANTEEMLARGMAADQLSRPNDRRRAGFIESHGAGALLLCRASLAVRMGLPVHGIVAFARSFGDGVNLSVPAPGQGALCAVTESPRTAADAASACGFQRRRAQVLALKERREEMARVVGADQAAQCIADARRRLGHTFFHGREDISPLRGALAVYGLGPDDVAVASKHDSSTTANDLNENRLHAALQEQLGRTPGLPLWVVSQKSLTGHPKGAAAAWQMNGLLQLMADGVLPGNRALDDVDPSLAAFPFLSFTDQAVPLGPGVVRAGLVTSLGFGHVSALVCLVHPFLFWRMLGERDRREYEAKLRPRLARATQRLQDFLSGRVPLVRRRTERPFLGRDGSPAQLAHERRILTDSSARLVPGESRYSP